MATEPQSAFHGPVNTSLCGMYPYPKTWMGGREGGREGGKSKRVMNKMTQAKAHGNAPANLPRVPLHWLGLNFAKIIFSIIKIVCTCLCIRDLCL